jgi:Restriction endonuclease
VLRSAKLTTRLGTNVKRQQARELFRKHQEEVRRSKQTLESLSRRLNELGQDWVPKAPATIFQDWFYDLMDFFEVTNRRPYVVNGRQIDGSVTVSGTTYLVELTFTREQTGAPDVDTMLKKIHDKADNTMGIMVSISGFSETAVSEASGPRTPVLLMDHRHLYLTLGGGVTVGEIIDRVRRHASQAGEALLAPDRFEG